MTLFDIMDFDLINSVDESKVAEIAKSIEKNGFVGAPILVWEDRRQLITGSHRLAALKMLYEADKFDADTEVAESVDDLLEDVDMSVMFEYDYLGQYFEGTRIEKYKNEIEEW